MRPTPRPRRRHAAFAFLLLAFWLALCPALRPGPAAAENQAESLREDLTSEKARADQAKSALGQLTEKERTLFSRLAGLEDQVGRMTKTVMAQEAALAKAEAEEERIRARYAVLAAERDQAFAALSDLLALTWPVHRENLENRLGGMSSWQSADRRFTWLAAVYKAVRQGLARLREQSAALAANLAEQERLGAEAREKLNAVNASKDDLLSSKLSLAKSIREIRAERVSREEELADTLAAIDSLKYRLTNLTDRRFEGVQGGSALAGGGPAGGVVRARGRAAPPGHRPVPARGHAGQMRVLGKSRARRPLAGVRYGGYRLPRRRLLQSLRLPDQGPGEKRPGSGKGRGHRLGRLFPRGQRPRAVF